MPTANHPAPRMETGMTTTQRFLGAITALMIAASTNAQSAPSPPAAATIVLVHGALIDGSSWRRVYDVLTRDGFVFLDPAKFAADFGADLPKPQAEFMAHSQMPVSGAAFNAKLTAAAWRDKPSYAIVATQDRALNPELARWMAKRAGSKVTVLKASHAVHISHPRAVARVIETAARAVK